MPPAINTHSHIFTLLRALLGSTSLLQGQECAASFFSASPKCAFVRSLKAPRILEATHIPGFDPINKSHQPIRSRIVPASGVSHLGCATKMSSHENSEDLSKVAAFILVAIVC
ncbi:hypothetical protein O6H91_Y438700 [Diphasiastrum complanatum]|nr:hypothetical protein O6H91_Y438700 [Diphasiastrum complanatum]